MKCTFPILIFALTLPSTTLAEETPWPQETLTYRPSELPGFKLVQGNCLTCHSAHYVAYQPPQPASYWDATVRKMKTVFGAPLEEKDIPTMVDYLTQTYGVAETSPSTTP
jgi:hypothetical protein